MATEHSKPLHKLQIITSSKKYEKNSKIIAEMTKSIKDENKINKSKSSKACKLNKVVKLQ